MKATDLFKAFSMPVGGSSCPDLLDTILRAYATTVAEHFVAEVIPIESPQCSGVRDIIARHVNDKSPTDMLWHPALGKIARSLEGLFIDKSEAAAEIALRLSSYGCSGCWNVCLTEPCVFLWGNILLPPVDRISVDSDGIVAHLTLHRGLTEDKVVLSRESQAWSVAKGNLLLLPTVGSSKSIVLIPGNAAAFVSPRISALKHEFLDVIEDDHASRFNDALNILSAIGAEYSDWIERLVYGVIPTKMLNPDEGGSSSWFDSPGLLHTSVYQDPIVLGETLLHEATYQYYYAITLVGPVDDGSDLRKYYSLPVQKERSLARILIAFHAFANVVLYYRMCSRLGYGSKLARYRHDTTLEMVLELRKPLVGNRALTDIGCSLFEPLSFALDTSEYCCA